MSGSSPRNVRTRRAFALLLLLAAAAVGFKLYWNDHQTAEHQAAVAAPMPSELTTRSHGRSSALSSPSHHSATATSVPLNAAESSTTARTSQSPRSSTVISTHLVPPVEPISPSHLFIPAIGVNTTVAAKPSSSQWDEFLGRYVESFGVPPDMYTTTWWNANAEGTREPRPGGRGMAIIVGHTQIGAFGVFNNLGKLRPGQVAGVSNRHVTLKFAVLAVKQGIPKSDGAALSRVLTNHPQAARLALITCSGHFNGRESVNNTVVFLRLVGVS